ncbi:MAG: translational GTPase TypA [Crocinitomicaceae bacterium]|nr:translational GTPase TypA [Crocinitomicaceae bacterium]MDG1735465.1 translational GTPase TypA [Crocinitomicaceae bacterium]MDG2506160.1 translational GTPase TypA [Crocinitomicaceae bacterium]
MEIRNIAIIAHVDHGKTTLVDKMIELGEVKDERNRPKGELIMDSNDLERERGITITSKNVSVTYKGTKINIIDTPGHADFGGEVERVLNMADGVCLLVDAFEGPMPQTRFVLGKALALGLKPIVVVNKVDKDNCTPDEVHEKVFDLMFDLDATEEQLDFPTAYGSAKNNWMSDDWKKPTTSIEPLLEMILTHFPPKVIQEGNTQMLITSLDFSSFVGRIAIGRLHRGVIKSNMPIILSKRDGSKEKHKIKDVFVFEGTDRLKVDAVQPGDICAITGLEGFEIGDSICDIENPDPLPTISIDEPTMSMMFSINDSPFFGKEGKFVTSRHISERLDKELEKNLALRVSKTDKADKWLVYGRGVMHLSVLIETMRREGYELQVGQPQVLIKEINGKKCEPMEELTIDLPEIHSGTAVDAVTKRKGEMTNMVPKGDRMTIEFSVPSRGIIGLRNYLLTATAGEAIMTHRFVDYQPYKGEIPGRLNGSLISMELGTSIPFSLNNLQERGTFFIAPGESIYEGQVIGENSRASDLVVNVTKTKQLTNMRKSGTDAKVRIIPPRIFSLEESLEYIQRDEYVEVTPKTLRIRKVHLTEMDRKRAQKS